MTFIIDSHRGAFKNGLLENSIPAFTESIFEGANCVECDIRITRDKEIVLIHNGTIDHIAKLATTIPDIKEFGEGPTGPIKEHTLAYLKSLKYPNDACILTLNEYLEFIGKYKIGAQIELKEGGYEDLILKTIEDANLDYSSHVAPVVCSSFNFLAVRRLVKKAKQYRIPLYTHDGDIGLAFGFQGIATGSFVGKFILRRFHKMNIWGGMTFYKYMPVKMLGYAHKYGVKFCPRIPNNKELAMEYLKTGVDGFETDDIAFVRKCVEESGRGNELTPMPHR
jgi:glycerophosphoryl diester phosphodiesterase